MTKLLCPAARKLIIAKTTWQPMWTIAWSWSLRRCPWSSSCSQPEHFLADLLVAPGVALQPLPPDSNHVQVGNATDLQFKAELGSTTRVSDLSSQDIALLLTGNALNVNCRWSLVWRFVSKITLNISALVSSLRTASGLWCEVVDTLQRPNKDIKLNLKLEARVSLVEIEGGPFPDTVNGPSPAPRDFLRNLN